MSNIIAKEKYLKDLFGSEFCFIVPDFQRQFSWEQENFQQLVEDIQDSIENFDMKDPYFLGSLILWVKDLHPDGSGVFSIIDGQQRITSLAILLACLRDLTVSSKAKQTLRSCVYQEEDPYKGVSDMVRVRVVDKYFDFYKNYILTDGGTFSLKNLDSNHLNEVQKKYHQAVRRFLGINVPRNRPLTPTLSQWERAA